MSSDPREGLDFVFGPFRLDPADQRLWRQGESVHLGGKGLAVLRTLLSRAGRLVTKEELLAEVWPDTAVGEAVLTTAIREVRRALDDRARDPRFVETVHGRGYRFIAPVSTRPTAELDPSGPPDGGPEPDRLPTGRPLPAKLVGREAGLRRLREWLDAARQGSRRIGFVAGEAGIGKTALLDAFGSQAARSGDVHLAHGQCIEHYGEGEAYMPLLEALGRLGRDGSLPLVDVLRRHAPSWLVHLPALDPGRRADWPMRATPAQMLRELAEAMEALTQRQTLILILEDLHWSDTATVEWLAYAARRRDPARLLVLGSYRPVEALLSRHPLRGLVAELGRDPRVDELVLDYLSSDAVEEYLRQRCGGLSRLDELAEILRRRTAGHPLFLSTIVTELLQRQAEEAVSDETAEGSVTRDLDAVQSMIPNSLRQFVEHRLELVSEQDQRILEAASVAGDRFSVALIAATTSLPEEMVEGRCAAWSGEGRFLVADGTTSWPDGTLAARYRFRHDLFHELIYARTSPERRVQLHRLAGERLERAFADRPATVASELAVHFERGRRPGRAVHHLGQAASKGLARSAYAEAERLLRRGLEMLDELGAGEDRLRRELDLSLLLGQVLMTTRGWGDEAVLELYGRMRTLCRELADEERLLQVLWGLMAVNAVRAELDQTEGLAEELLALARERGDRIFQLASLMELGGVALTRASLATARKCLNEADALYDPAQHHRYVESFGVDVGLLARSWETHLSWISGFPARARSRSDETVALAHQQEHPFTRALTLSYAAMLRQFDRDLPRVQTLSRAAVEHCGEHGFRYYHAWAEVLQSWLRVTTTGEPEGLEGLHRGLELLRRTAGFRLPYYLSLLADAQGAVRDFDGAAATLSEALAIVERTGERWWQAELERLQGELLLAGGRGGDERAAGCFRRAVDVARAQGAVLLELRAGESLAEVVEREADRLELSRRLADLRARLDVDESAG